MTTSSQSIIIILLLNYNICWNNKKLIFIYLLQYIILFSITSHLLIKKQPLDYSNIKYSKAYKNNLKITQNLDKIIIIFKLQCFIIFEKRVF